MANRKVKRAETKPIDPNVGAYRIPIAARYMGIGSRKVEQLVRSGAVPSLKIGRCRIIRKVDADNYLARQVAAS
jgi:excisionase family DNA binding protein